MKRTRFSARNRISADATELARLATGLAESGCKLEDAFWENSLAALVDELLKTGAEDDLNAALDRLFDTNPVAHDELADMVEARAETSTIATGNQEFDVLLINAPVLAWSRYAIPSGTIPARTLDTLGVQLQAHMLADGARLALADFLFRTNEEINTRVQQLSGGEKARLSLAVIAAKTPKLLLLDEVTNNLDLETRAHVISVLKDYPGAMIVVSHSMDFLQAIGINECYTVRNSHLMPWQIEAT